ncbi:MAG: sugar phosphate nucleotidyltransferase [Candidatus Omnitrophica bacterium]|nr:sugar phosphate nucleotidyltransferase [Candidatus Omnitrophota bacterium]
MQAVILAGGRGERLRPITNKIPKVLVPIKGRPFLEYQLKLLRRNEIRKIILLVGYMADRVKDYFKDGRTLDLNIEYVAEKELLGTAGALKAAENFLEESFFLINGDTYLDIDYRGVLSEFEKRGKMGLAVVYDNSRGDTGVKNNIAMDKDSMITDYEKASSRPSINLVEAGVLVFNRKVSSYIPGNRKCNIEDTLMPRLVKEREFTGYLSPKRFYDMGTLEKLKELERVLS